MVLYADRYQMLKYNSKSSMFMMDWTDASSDLCEEPYQRKINNALNFVEQSRPVSVLANLENMIYTGTFSNEDNITGKMWAKLEQIGVEKVAVINSNDFITKHLINQAIKTYKGKKYTIRFFKKHEDAMSWLMS